LTPGCSNGGKRNPFDGDATVHWEELKKTCYGPPFVVSRSLPDLAPFHLREPEANGESVGLTTRKIQVEVFYLDVSQISISFIGEFHFQAVIWSLFQNLE